MMTGQQMVVVRCASSRMGQAQMRALLAADHAPRAISPTGDINRVLRWADYRLKWPGHRAALMDHIF